MNEIARKKFNINFLGDTTVGKTSIIKRHINKTFDESAIATIGIDNIKDEKEFDNKKYSFKIYDTAGQERYRSISLNYIKLGDGFLLVFSVDNRETFDKLDEWVQNIYDSVPIDEKVIFLVGNKIDSPDRVITKEEAEAYAKKKNFPYYETSAKTGDGIEKLFDELYNNIYNLNKKADKNSKGDKIKLNPEKTKKRRCPC
jgi:small GTP-binding protein